MDSPESNKIVASSSSADSPVVQESPFFNFLRTLSPIKPVKAATNIAQGLSGINIPSPPPVFTSPRLHPQSEIFFLKRSKDFKTSNANSSIDHENRDHVFAAGSEVSERPIGQLMSGLVPCNKKTQETKSVPLAQLSSPTGYVDEYLTDPVEEESMKSSDLASSCLNQVVDGETNSKVDGNNDKFMKNMATGSDEKSKSSGQTEGNTQEMQLAVVEPGNIKDGGRRSVECSDLMSEEFKDILLSESDFSQEPASGEENTQHVETQTSQHARVLPHEPIENKTADLEEVSQHQRGTLRRCLQFDASAGRRKFVSSNRGFSNPASINRCSSTSSNPPELETMESSPLVLPTSTNTCTMNSSQPVASTLIPGSSKVPENRVDKCLWNVGNSSLKAPLPSGIGLHLNSIVNAAAKGSTRSLSINSTEKEYQATQGEKRPSVLKLHILEEYKSTSLPKFVEGKFSAKNHNDQQETESLVAENSSTYKFPYDASDKFQESDQLSLKDTGKRTQPFEDENCKRCNCRRSKCLKLYCECFAAGIYCAEPCACQECFNKPEYEDMVLATRKHIESRNPLAFAPKVVRRVTDSPANSKEDNDKATPASARHKRGCNCKKSMCLKKYCECYQSGVGCSIACRCDGCKNTFGAKDGHDESSGVLSRKVDADTSEDLPEVKLTMETTKMQMRSEHHHSKNLTPSFQTSKHGKGMLKSRLPGRRLSSPESDTKVLSSYAQSPSSPGNLSTHDKRARMGRQGNVDIIFDQVEFSTTGSMDQLSPRWDGFEDMCNITPSAQVSSKSTAMSSPSSSKSHTKVSRVQLQGSVRVSGSLRWRSSPIAPMSWLGESKTCQEGDSDIGYEILDETPDILKDAHTPTKSVKASSPNQKRISPPYNHLHNLRSSPSPALKSGRKFVLQSISSLPSVTPDSDPKESSSTN